MTSFRKFKEELKSALPNLYDPTHTFSDTLFGVVNMEEDEGRRALRGALIKAIEDLRPDPGVPRHARAWRIYDLLRLRYVEQRTQEEAAARLAITVRHLAREQKKAIHLLARRLWERREKPSDRGIWERQVEEEVASIQAHAPGAIADVNEILEDVARLTEPLLSGRDVDLKIALAPDGASVALHPSILRQAVVAAVTYALDVMEEGEICLASEREGDHMTVLMEAHPISAATSPPPPDWLGRELLTSQGATIDCTVKGDELALRMSLPPARRARILVVDDNEDLYHVYELCTRGTAFQLSNLTEGRRIFEVIASHKPDIIVLDLILPDVDGWELLAQLHEHPLSRDIPIIVCSVVRERELAHALGATACMIKPIGRQELIQALEKALSRVSEEERGSPANSAATG